MANAARIEISKRIVLHRRGKHAIDTQSIKPMINN